MTEATSQLLAEAAARALKAHPGQQQRTAPDDRQRIFELRDFNRFGDLKRAGLFGSRMSLWRAIKAGKFPPGRRISPQIVIWTRDEVLVAVEAMAVPVEPSAPPAYRVENVIKARAALAAKRALAKAATFGSSR